jgi:hypothetical protein
MEERPPVVNFATAPTRHFLSFFLISFCACRKVQMSGNCLLVISIVKQMLLLRNGIQQKNKATKKTMASKIILKIVKLIIVFVATIFGVVAF